MGVVLANFSNQQSGIFSQLMLVSGVISNQYFSNAIDFGGCFCSAATVATRNQNLDIATNGFSRSHNIKSCAFKASIIVFSNY